MYKSEKDIETLQRVIDAMHDCLADTEAQHRSESAQFGDSWPGAQTEIAEARTAIELTQIELDRAVAAFVGPPLWAWQNAPFDSDIPF